MGQYAFKNCKSLKEIIIPEGINKIKVCTFDNCISLKEINIPKGVEIMDNYPFYKCTNLEKITYQGKEHQVKCIDDYCMEIHSTKQKEDFTIHKASYFSTDEKCFIAEKDGYYAHGGSIREALTDLQFKLDEQKDYPEIIKNINEKGYFGANDYRLLTGACKQGTNKFIEDNNYTWDDKMNIKDVLIITKGHYGHEKLCEFIPEFNFTEADYIDLAKADSSFKDYFPEEYKTVDFDLKVVASQKIKSTKAAKQKELSI